MYKLIFPGLLLLIITSCELPPEYEIYHWAEGWINTIDINGNNLKHLSELQSSPGYGDLVLPFISEASLKIFQSNGSGMWILNGDGSNRQLIFSYHDSIGSLAGTFSISNDGQKIAFSGGGNIYIMNMDASGLKKLTSDSWSDHSPQFSPDDNLLVFVSRNHHCLAAIDTSGSKRFEIVDNSGDNSASSYFKYPIFSPDGNRIFYNYNSGQTLSGIYSIYLDGSGKKQLHQGILATNPLAFSKDGRKLVFSLLRHIFVMNPEGSQKVDLGEICGYNCYPAISSDGSSVAFGTEGERSKLYLINSDGSGIKYLTEGDKPHFIEDDTRILFLGLKWFSKEE